ncbi:YbbR-like domain-containing protein [Chengkuizengella sp. SCS-71B]|uniref:CdaR family protein n=1 Tax=Chengkuizengella sp. SCS-71B TaxID=3115290 RepID=UPI0032C23A0D
MDKWLGNITVVRIAAVIFGILLWAFVQLDQQVATPPPTVIDTINTEQSRGIDDFPITILNLGEDLHIQEKYYSSVNVVLKGKETDIKPVSKENEKYKIAVDLSNKGAGRHHIRLDSIGFPDDVEVELYPPTVTVVIEEIITTSLPIEINVKGDPGEGYEARKPILSTEEVSITAPSSVIEQISSVQSSVDVTNVHEDIVTELSLAAYDKNSKQVEVGINPSKVKVEIPIISPSKTLDLRVNLRGETPKGYSVVSFKQSIDEVTLYGSEDVLKDYNVYDDIEIDLSNLTSDRVSSHILTVPDGIKKIEPQKVEVEIIIVPSETKTFANFPITLIGLNSNEYEIAFSEPTDGLLDLIVDGAPSILENLSENNIDATVDISGLSPGSYERSIQLTLPNFVKYGGDSPLKVFLEIKPIPEEVIDTEPETNEEGETDIIDETETQRSETIEGGIRSENDEGLNLPISENSSSEEELLNEKINQ